MERVVTLLATGGGAGYSRWAPGTVGSLWGPVLVWGLMQVSSATRGYLVAGVLLGSLILCEWALRYFHKKDPPQVVLDEIAAFTIVFLPVLLEMPGFYYSRRVALFGFLWFRLFDVTKPWPIRQLEQLPGGLGVLVDDLAAGLYAAMGLYLTVKFCG